MVDLQLKGKKWWVTGTIKRPDGRKVRIRKSTGCSVGEKLEAMRLLAEIVQKEMSDEYSRVDTTLKEAINQYLRRPSPPGATMRGVLVRLDGQYGHVKLSELRLYDMVAWCNRGHRQAGTVRREMGAINAMLNHGHEIGLAVPAWRLKKPSVDDARTRWLTEAERDRLIISCDEEIRALVTFLFFTGARLGEATKMTWSDITADEVYLTSWKGRPKRKRIRAVKLIPGLIDVLGERGEPDDFVFTTPLGSPITSRYGALYKMWERAKAKAGIEDFRFHDCRHTFATHLLKQGAILPEIGNLLGHKTTAMVERYAHLQQSRLGSVMDTFGGIPDDVADTFAKWLIGQNSLGLSRGAPSAARPSLQGGHGTEPVALGLSAPKSDDDA